MRTNTADPSSSGGHPLARRGDDAASLRRFFDAAMSEVYPYLFKRCGHDRETAQDLTQETFVAAVSSLRRGVVDSLSIGWMMTTARSRLIDHYRDTARRDRPIRLIASSAPELPDATVLNASVTEELLDSLPATQRMVVALHHLDGLPVSRVAELTGMSVRAVESSLARARRTLRVTLEEMRDGT